MACRKLYRWFLFLPGLLLVLASPVAADDKKPKPPAEDNEVKLGRESATETDKELKLVTDAAVLERVNRIGQELAAVANVEEIKALWGDSKVKKFTYSFKVVDEKDVNAFSLPGGFIYVNKGLLDYVHSDDELAGVLAHEVAHAAHHHMMKLIREQNKIQNVLLPALLAAIVVGKSGGDSAGNLLLGGQLYLTAKLNTYGVEAEKDADQTGMHYLTKTKYNPVGLLTFMERLAKDEQRGPERTLGIYRTHPPSPERARSALAELKELNIPVNRRSVDPMIRATSTIVMVKGVSLAEVKMYKTVVGRFAAADGQTAEERGKKIADLMNTMFDQGLQMYEVRLSPDKSRVLARYWTLAVFTPADAAPQSQSVPELAQSALEAVKSLLWQDQMNKPSGVPVTDR